MIILSLKNERIIGLRYKLKYNIIYMKIVFLYKCMKIEVLCDDCCYYV